MDRVLEKPLAYKQSEQVVFMLIQLVFIIKDVMREKII